MGRHGDPALNSAPLSPDALEAAIRAIGAERYHDKHPFHRLLHGGKLNKGQVQAWALNRYCYQTAVPRKDAALMSRVLNRDLRREWVHRILDHDGTGDEEGGIERWLALTKALGLERAYVTSMEGALPATRFAVEAYVTFVRERRVVIDGTVRTINPQGTHRRHVGELRLHQQQGFAIFSTAS
jgi:pyrroloquinoline-quinone synthase